MSNCRRNVLSAVALVVVGWSTAAVAAPSWSFKGTVAEGKQIDVVRGPKDHIHLVSNRYYQFDASGKVVVTEAQGDEQQSFMSFPPAIAAGDDGTVHMITRHSGDYAAGYVLRYRRRSAKGVWDRDYEVGSPTKRNYVVGIGWTGPNQVYVLSSKGGDNVWGDLHLWQAGVSSASHLGSLTGLWRADADARLRGRAGRLYLVSGKPDSAGKAYFASAPGGSGVFDALKGSLDEHAISGGGRQGFPDMYIDRDKHTHMTFGAQGSVYYNQYKEAGGRVFAKDRKVLDGLGSWHLSVGLSAVAASDDGSYVIAVGLRTNSSKDASNSEIVWSLSSDGGASWGGLQATGHHSDGGEGRHRPRLVAIDHQFYLFYQDVKNSGISLATLALPACQDGETEACGSDVGACQVGTSTCKQGKWGPCAGEIQPTAEICDGLDNNCDGHTDEGCADGGVSDGAVTDGEVTDGAVADGSLGGDSGPAGEDGGANVDGASAGGGVATDGDPEGCSCRVGGAGGGKMPTGAGIVGLLMAAALASRRRGRQARR